MDNAKLIQAAIPDELRLASHPDAALVNEAIATVLTAWNESDRLTDAGRAKDVHKALKAYFDGTFTKHISEEDELWNKTKALAELAPKPHEIAAKKFDDAASDADYDAAMSHAMALMPTLDDDGRAHISRAVKGYHRRSTANENYAYLERVIPVEFSYGDAENPTTETATNAIVASGMWSRILRDHPRFLSVKAADGSYLSLDDYSKLSDIARAAGSK